jgi:hypothetical protein
MRLLILLLISLTVPAFAQDDQEPPPRRARDLTPEERQRLRQGTYEMRAVGRSNKPRCGPDCVEKRRREWVAEAASKERPAKGWSVADIVIAASAIGVIIFAASALWDVVMLKKEGVNK